MFNKCSLHMEKLANLPNILSDSNLTEIKKFYADTNRNNM